MFVIEMSTMNLYTMNAQWGGHYEFDIKQKKSIYNSEFVILNNEADRIFRQLAMQ